MIKQLENYCELCKTITLWKRVANTESHLEWECQNANPMCKHYTSTTYLIYMQTKYQEQIRK
jgi:hypothetical protein